MADTSSVISVSISGLYGLEVAIGACRTAAEMVVVVDGFDNKMCGIKAYPNPVSGMMVFDATESAGETCKISVFNLLSVPVGDLTLTNPKSNRIGYFDFGNLPVGIYFIQFDFPDRVYRLKVIKQ